SSPRTSTWSWPWSWCCRSWPCCSTCWPTSSTAGSIPGSAMTDALELEPEVDRDAEIPVVEPSAETLEVESLERQLVDKPQSLGSQAMRAFITNKLALAGMFMLLVMILIAIFGPMVRPYGF